MGYGWGWYKPVIKEVDIIPSKEEPLVKPTTVEDNAEKNELACKYCNRTFKSKAGRLSHERYCKEAN